MNDRSLIEEIRDLRARSMEYEHALSHVISCASCDDCKQLATSALNGVGRDDFLEAVGQYCLDEFCDCDICGWWSSCSCHGPSGACRKVEHNHVTTVVLPPGECPACDQYLDYA